MSNKLIITINLTFRMLNVRWIIKIIILLWLSSWPDSVIIVTHDIAATTEVLIIMIIMVIANKL